ncbi:MAG: HNH endonuclease [Chloroflexi bacterium]|nr:HNH endonuclease [Chloroflexota bacterium]MYD17413.1 HNH endonuclease [Chloroflexota bacterium]MYJ01788.1 HNH endonuclease [Chloroflexota bacterium]
MSNHYLEIDHKWPLSRNGGNEFSNLQLLCTSCNLRKGIQTDEEFRERYWRLLLPDGSIPDPPIPQDLFTEETQLTRASPEVRSIYRERFEAARRRRQPAGCLTSLFFLAVVFAAIAEFVTQRDF